MRPLTLDVVICTYDNPDQLAMTLSSLSSQRGVTGEWGVLVVDNNSGPATTSVVDEFRHRGDVPGLRRVVETKQGLTSARRRGVSETTGDWLAFVDDDCELDPSWIAEALEFARSSPRTRQGSVAVSRSCTRLGRRQRSADAVGRSRSRSSAGRPDM